MYWSLLNEVCTHTTNFTELATSQFLTYEKVTCEKYGRNYKTSLHMFEILKSCQKCIFGLIKLEKFSQCLHYCTWFRISISKWHGIHIGQLPDP